MSDAERNSRLVERNFRERINYIRLRQKALARNETFAGPDGQKEPLGGQHILILRSSGCGSTRASGGGKCWNKGRVCRKRKRNNKNVSSALKGYSGQQK